MTNESERAKFEAWAKGRGLWLNHSFTDPENRYCSRDAQFVWEVWLARAKSSGAAVPVSELEALAEEWATWYEPGDECAVQLRDLIAKHTGRK